MNKLDELESRVEDTKYVEIESKVILELIKVARAGQEIGWEYLKCPQNPHNDPVVRWREIHRLVDALKELEK